MEIQPLFVLDTDTDVSAVEDAAAAPDTADCADTDGSSLDDSVAVLAAFRDQATVEDTAATAQLELAVAYAAFNSADSIADAAVVPRHPGIDAEIPLAGEGAPWISEFAVVEFAAATGRSQHAARHYLGEALELAYRLPKTWAAVTAGRVSGWRARRVAARTQPLPPDGAAWVDSQVAPFVGKIGPVQLDRIIGEAITRYDPETAADRMYDDLERRHVDIQPDILDGATATATLEGVLDLADGLDLDATLADLAAQLKPLGSTDPLRIRRAQALGHLARGEYLLTPTDTGDTDDTDAGTADGEPGAGAGTGLLDTGPQKLHARETARRVREIVLHLRINHAAIWGCGDGIATLMTPGGRPLGQVMVEQIQAWCAGADTRVTIKPVIDLDERLTSHGYQPSDRLRPNHHAPSDLRVPPLHPRLSGRRPRPHHTLANRPPRPAHRRRDRLTQPRPVVSAPPPSENTRRMDLHPPHHRRIPLDQPPRLPVPRHHPRHHRHHPQHTPEDPRPRPQRPRERMRDRTECNRHSSRQRRG